MSASLLERINARMHSGTCPTVGSLGECPALIQAIPTQTIHGDRVHVIAAICIWDATFNDPEAVAAWFKDEGALEVTVNHVLHDPDNEIFGGKSIDNARDWTIDAWFPPGHPSIADIVERGPKIAAPNILRDAASDIDARAALRDCPDGERSMARCVLAFNAITGHSLREVEGWHFMEILKLARATAGGHHLDDHTDRAAYAALAGECADREARGASR